MVVVTPNKRDLITGPALHFIRKGDTIGVAFTITVDLRPENFDITKMAMLFKFRNGDIKKLVTNKGSRIIDQGTGVIIAFETSITSSDITYFQQNLLEALRLSYNGNNGGYYDKDINESLGEKIINSINCIL